MGFGIKIAVWGNYACFTRPELKVERVSYDVITPSAARGVLEAIYWKPAIRWVIDEIQVQNEILWTNIRRNELLGTVPMQTVQRAYTGSTAEQLKQYTTDNITQRATLFLKDVCYIISAHFELTEKCGPEDTQAKHYNVMLRHLRKGQCYFRPYLGCREFAANFSIIENAAYIPPSFYQGTTIDFGFMLWDMDFSNPQSPRPIFFNAIMENGIIKVPNLHKEGEAK